MFVTAADFNTAPYNIPNLEAMGDSFTDLVNRVEESTLREVLGDAFYEAFIAGLAADPIAQRWVDLRDGVKYNNLSNYQRAWKGMKAVFIPLVYANYLHDDYTNLGQYGNAVVNTENAEVATPALRIARAQNEAVKVVNGDASGYWLDMDNSLYGYLYSTVELYASDVAAAGYPDFRTYLSDQYNFLYPVNHFGL